MMFSKEDIKEILAEVLESRDNADCEKYKEQHRWIEQQIERDKARKEMYKTITTVILQWSIPLIIGGLFYYFRYGKWPA